VFFTTKIYNSLVLLLLSIYLCCIGGVLESLFHYLCCERMATTEEYKPALLDRLLRCGKGSPKIRALAGYHLLRIMMAVMITHSGIGNK
jgi:hypothetical protein